jgi:hypothetical protein
VSAKERCSELVAVLVMGCNRYHISVTNILNYLVLNAIAQIKQAQHSASKVWWQTPAEAHPLFVFIIIAYAAKAKVATLAILFLCYLLIDPVKNGR